MTERDRRGRYAHLTAHAGFDRDGVEWEMCEHCGGYRPNHEGRFVISAHPPLMPGRLWTEEERAAPVGTVTCGICLTRHP